MDGQLEAERQIQNAKKDGSIVLNLSNLSLTTLPETIGQLTQLTRLDLGDNQLTTLPKKTIDQLTQLTWLGLSGNQLTSLPETIGQLSQLTELHLWGNQLTTLPEIIGQLTQLTRLDLGDNQLTTLPKKTIGQLTQLTVLGLSGNQLTTLPKKTIDQLTQLTVLDLSGNQLTTLPETIGQLTQLTWLGLSGNQLTTLPATLENIKKISICNLANNPINVPERLKENQLRAALRYLKYNKKEIQWINWGGMCNLFLEKKTWLALVETVLAVFVASFLLASLDHPLYWLLWASMGWLLLLRTEHTVDTGLRWFGRIVGYLNIKNSKYNSDSITLPLRLLILGLLSLPIKIGATCYATLWPHTHLRSVFFAIPRNLRNHTLAVDLTTPPELIPGSEARYLDAPATTITQNDLSYDIADGDEDIPRRYKYKRYTLTEWLNRLILGLFFIIAWCYRWSLKSTAIIYWPLYFIDSAHGLINAGDVTKNYANDKLSKLGIIVFTILSAYTLSHYPKLYLIKDAVEQSDYFPTSLVETIVSLLNPSLYTQNYEPWLGSMTLHVTVIVFTIMLIVKMFLSDRLSKRAEDYQGPYLHFFKAALIINYSGAALLTWYGWEFVFRSLIFYW